MTPPSPARAHVLARYGKRTDVLAFEARPAQPLAPDEVRIEVEAVALNPVDLKAMEGEPRMLLPFAPPFVPGSDLAGTVAEVGPAVEDLRPGDPVFAYARTRAWTGWAPSRSP
jgi:NADPH:quinone reductase-like Zn-dependent oxidoreductase